MSSIIKVDTVQDQDGNNIINESANTITIGASGDTITIPSGATLANNGTATGFFEGIAWQSITTAATLTTVAGRGYPINTTSNACTVTLPSSASVGDQVQIVDYAGTFASNNITLTSSLKIEGGTGDKLLTTNREGVIITYVDATQGWVATTGVNSGDQAIDPLPPYSADFLVIGGGGSGGSSYGAGGGAGGYRTSTQSVSPSTAITITVGDGGAGISDPSTGTAGSNSSISGSGLTTITSAGGGYGAPPVNAGGSGGSGGGGARTTAGSGNTPSTSPSQGNDGTGGSTGAPNYSTGAGGGAGGVGSAPTGSAGGNGGAGTASTITGSSVTRAGGGGGGCYNGGTAGSGGTGGGGNSGAYNVDNGTDGTVNTGSGGGGGGMAASTGKSGGKGVVILSIPDANYSGTTTGSPTVATGVGGKTILTFTGTGSYTA